MDSQFIIIVIFSILAAVYIIASVERKKSNEREAELIAELIEETFSPVNCRCGLEDVSIKIHWEYGKLENDKKWVGMVNGTECFVIHRPKNSDDYRLWLFNGKMIGSYESIDEASAEAAKIANFMSYYFDGD